MAINYGRKVLKKTLVGQRLVMKDGNGVVKYMSVVDR